MGKFNRVSLEMSDQGADLDPFLVKVPVLATDHGEFDKPRIARLGFCFLPDPKADKRLISVGDGPLNVPSEKTQA